MTQQDINAINNLVQKRLDITIREIKEKLHVNVCEEMVRKAVIELGYRVKEKSVHASEQERSRCEGKTNTLERTYTKSSD